MYMRKIYADFEVETNIFIFEDVFRFLLVNKFDSQDAFGRIIEV